MLATAVIDGTPSAGTHKGEVVPQMWTYEKSLAPAPSGSPYRAFVWMQGHNYANFALPNVQQMLLRAIAWTGKRPIDTLMTERPQRGRGTTPPAGAPAAGRGGRGGGRTEAEGRSVARSPEEAEAALSVGLSSLLAEACEPDLQVGRGMLAQIKMADSKEVPVGIVVRQADKDGFIHRSWVGRGLPEGIFDGRPIIGICNTWSELTPCNLHFREIAEHVKRGVWEMGGIPFEFPVTSLGETSLRPTAMLFRNLAAMDVEESIRGNPIDGVVLLCGCDKTTPALIMGAASCDLPAIVVSGGTMLNGQYRGKPIGSGTDVWRFSEEVKAGQMSLKEFMQAESCMSRSTGTCNVMGTASTMASMAESLGLGLPNNAAIPASTPAVTRRHLAGRRIMELVEQDVRISRILTREAFENAIRSTAVGGSTSAVIRLLAIAGRVGRCRCRMTTWGATCRRWWTDAVRALPDEDFYYAGGLPAAIRSASTGLNRDMTVNGHSIWENCKDARTTTRKSSARSTKPLAASGIAVLKAACRRPARFQAPAASPSDSTAAMSCFENIEHYNARSRIRRSTSTPAVCWC